MAIERTSADAIARAAAILRRGGLVGIPTETVYGLAANAADDPAIAGIFAAKERPRFNPLIVHVRDVAHAQTLVRFSGPARCLAEAFWPGPLTLVLPRRAHAPVSLLASAGLDTIAVRVPAHETARAVLEESRLAIAAPSANRSGTVSSTTPMHVAENFGDAVALILDAGPAPLGIESTIVGFVDSAPTLLRPGALAREDIEAAIGPLQRHTAAAIASPGQMRSHYAPTTRLRLNVRAADPGEAVLAFGKPPINAPVLRNLSETGDLREAAANLFAMLYELDRAGASAIAVMPIPETGLGEAINDRLRRAAAPKES